MPPDPSRPFVPIVLEALAGHGLRPDADTSVDVEIRRLRGRLLAGEIAKASYADAVRTLRLRYLLLSLPKDQWRVR
jgi:hypothetical protein